MPKLPECEISPCASGALRLFSHVTAEDALSCILSRGPEEGMDELCVESEQGIHQGVVSVARLRQAPPETPLFRLLEAPAFRAG